MINSRFSLLKIWLFSLTLVTSNLPLVFYQALTPTLPSLTRVENPHIILVIIMVFLHEGQPHQVQVTVGLLPHPTLSVHVQTPAGEGVVGLPRSGGGGGGVAPFE